MQIAKRYLKYASLDPKEIELSKIDLHNYLACPDPDNLYRWYYVIYDIKETPYEGGYYVG